MTPTASDDVLGQAIASLDELAALLDSARAGAIPPEMWLLFRFALGDAIAERAAIGWCQDCADEGSRCGPHVRDARLRELYGQALDYLGGQPESRLLAPLEALPRS